MSVPIDPASGEVISLPDAGEAPVNRLHLVRGRLPMPDERDGVVVLKSFADAHRLEVGDVIPVTLYGGHRVVVVTGVNDMAVLQDGALETRIPLGSPSIASAAASPTIRLPA